MRKRRTRYSERNTRCYSRKGQTFQQIILSIVALFLVVIFLVVLCTDPMGNNGSVPPESVMAAEEADETADSNVSQSDESVSHTASADGLDQTSDGQTDSTASSSDWRLRLVNRLTPNSRSSSLTALDRLGWETWSSADARVILLYLQIV